MKISDIGEFGLIGLIRQWTAHQPGAKSLILGIGDDAAAWQTRSEVLLATTDTMVEGVHFLPGDAGSLGWKLMAANLSDLAAMGGQPQTALVSLALPPTTEVSWVEELYREMLAAAGEHGVALVGGDTVSSPVAVLTVTLLGRAQGPDRILRRSAARVGDLLAVTGFLGNSEGGLRVLKGLANPGEDTALFLTAAHLRPKARVAEGQALVALGIRAAIDISDGLLADAGHLCTESGVAATLEASSLPIHPCLRNAFPHECLQMAATGGEDYELLFSAPAELIEQSHKALSVPVTVIGRVESGPPGKVVLLGTDGSPVQLPRGGWEHFKPAPCPSRSATDQ